MPQLALQSLHWNCQFDCDEHTRWSLQWEFKVWLISDEFLYKSNFLEKFWCWKLTRKLEVEEVFDEVWDEEPGTMDPIFWEIRCYQRYSLRCSSEFMVETWMKTMLMSKSKLIISELVKLKIFEQWENEVAEKV